tara:strand:- start:1871 stop:2524 length:654 start_codon:yes stop_codon:yes gene_type:complete
MGDIYDTKYLATLSDDDYEEAMKVQWPWGANRIEFTKGEDRDIDQFGDSQSLDTLMGEINNGRMHDIDKMIDDSIISQETIIIDTQSTDSVKGILEESNLSRLFFSPQNIEALHSMIRYYVHKMTDGKVVSKQSPDELFIVMRSILLQYGNFINTNVLQEIKRLNSKVVTICSDKVSQEVLQYNKYVSDLQNLPVPLDNPHYVNKNNFTYDISNLPQ